MRTSGTTWFLLIFLALLVILTVAFALNPQWGNAFDLARYTDPNQAGYGFAGGLILAALACFLGALVPFPVPYILVVALVASNFLKAGYGIPAVALVVVLSTAANTVGDILDYLVGSLGRWASGRRDKTEIPETRWSRIIRSKPALIPVVCFFFGLTPLPDSLLFMPLGLMAYPMGRLLFWNALGKLTMMTVVAVAGVVAFDLLFALVGGEAGESSWISGMAVLYLSWGLMAAMVIPRRDKPSPSRSEGRPLSPKRPK